MKVLVITLNEICYNPRLIKAADYFQNKGASITIFNPVVGIGSFDTYESFKKRKSNWTIIENDISKKNFRSKIKWLGASIFQKLALIIWKKFKQKFGFSYIMNKGLWSFPFHLFKLYDVLLINLVNNLPIAAELKKINPKAVFIYDSQEYFRGQYMNDSEEIKSWVNAAEENHIRDTDIVIATTEVMRKRLVSEFDLKNSSFRVRNLPLKSALTEKKITRAAGLPLRLVWHGFVVNYEGNRGVTVLLNALTMCKCNFVFYLQGFINEMEKHKIIEFATANKIDQYIIFVPPSDPERIVESLLNYDVGLIGEMPAEENQQLTSSNKLFEYISSGLAVLAPDLPGLAETLDEFEVGIKYSAGNAQKLSELIDKLFDDPALLSKFQQNSIHAANTQLYWENDYALVYDQVEKIMGH